MLVNAHAFPGPALWQGLMLIVLSMWGLSMVVWPPKNPMRFLIRVGVVIGIGVALAVWIIKHFH